jgi:leucyl/phenylalanyl-tRNA---protein transferase
MLGSPKPFDLDDLIGCYRQGVFPMADSAHDDQVFLVDPEERGILPFDAFHIPRRLVRTVRADPYQVRIDTAFAQVLDECARPRPGRRETWINAPIRMMYRDLFAAGHAHSLECWLDGRLVGGLYGVSVGGAFFGESMFSTERDASKVALVHLVARLVVGGYELLDAQFMTEHLAQFGAREIPRRTYHALLESALKAEPDFYRLPAFTGGAAVLQAISQAS